MSSGMWNDETSGIHKFDISSERGKAIYKATGTVTGRMLNQFCLGEWDDHLRVATTTGGNWDWTNWDNHISIFKEDGGNLVKVGGLSGIGKEEEIYAARFMGDRGFLVTFRQTDPLYTFNLKDHSNPLVVGEWKGPGYSTYLHPYGENHLISIGREGWRIALSLYDLTNFAKPTLVERFMFQDEYSDLNSVALNDHKGFTFYTSRNLLAIPYDGWIYSWQREGYETGIFLFNVDTDGFTVAGNLALSGTQEYEGAAMRSVFIGDILYGISSCRITSCNLNTPSDEIDSLKLYTGDYCDNGYDNEPGWDDDWDGDWDEPDDTGSWEEDWETDGSEGDWDGEPDTDGGWEGDTDTASDSDW